MKFSIRKILIVLFLCMAVCGVSSADIYDKLYTDITGETEYLARLDKEKKGVVQKATFSTATRVVEISLSNSKEKSYSYKVQYPGNKGLTEKGTFDFAGRLTSEQTFFNGKPACTPEGYSRRELNYSLHRVVEKLYDSDNKPTMCNDGYSIKVLKYNNVMNDLSWVTDFDLLYKAKWMYSVSYFDTDSLPVSVFNDSYHKKIVTIDKSCMRIAYKDIEGGKASDKYGYSDITCKPRWKSTSQDGEFAKNFSVSTYCALSVQPIKKNLMNCCGKYADKDMALIEEILNFPISVTGKILREKDSTSEKYMAESFLSKYFSNKVLKIRTVFMPVYYLNSISKEIYEDLEGWDITFYNANREPVNVNDGAMYRLKAEPAREKYIVTSVYDAGGQKLSK